MIRLRLEIVRWLRHPAVGPILIVLLAVVLAFLVLHEASEGSIESLLAACVTLAALGGLVLLRRQGNVPLMRQQVTARARPPAPRRLARAVATRPNPLRL